MSWLEWCCAPLFRRQRICADVSSVHIVPTSGGWVIRHPSPPSLVSCTASEIAVDADMDEWEIQPRGQDRV